MAGLASCADAVPLEAELLASSLVGVVFSFCWPNEKVGVSAGLLFSPCLVSGLAKENADALPPVLSGLVNENGDDFDGSV